MDYFDEPAHYRAFIERKVMFYEAQINKAIEDVMLDASDSKAWWRDDEGIHHINFKNGIGFTVDVRLHHSPNVDTQEVS